LLLHVLLLQNPVRFSRAVDLSEEQSESFPTEMDKDSIIAPDLQDHQKRRLRWVLCPNSLTDDWKARDGTPHRELSRRQPHVAGNGDPAACL
jgi:hypothetical protein